MTNVHIATYLHHKQIIYAYLDIPIGHITLHLSLSFTSHALNGSSIRGERTRPTTTPTPVWHNRYQAVTCRRGRGLPKMAQASGVAVRPGTDHDAGGAGGQCHQAKPAPSILPVSGREGDAGHLFGACRRARSAQQDVFDHLVGRPDAEPLAPIVRVCPERVRLVRPRRGDKFGGMPSCDRRHIRNARPIREQAGGAHWRVRA
jgi:hypothetical protein